MKKIFAAAALLLFAAAAAGCGATGSLADEVKQNDVLTMTPLNKDNMTITIRAEYNVNNEAIRSVLAKKFPDVNFVSVFHCSGETQYELRQSMLGGDAEDILISPNMKSVADIAGDHLMDMSAESFSSAYTGQSLEECQIDGRVYYLPGPSSVYGIIYDRTMFSKKGWSVPHSLTEFLSLVEQIDKTGVRAIQPTCKYSRQAQLVLTMFNYEDTFGGVDNALWIKEFQQGKASFTGHLENALKRYQQLNGSGVIRSSDFEMQPGNRSNMMYNDHTCAMIIENEQAEFYAKQQNSDHEYGMFPFWSGDSENSDYLMSIPSWYIGINRSLGEKGSEKKLEMVKKAISYLSTPEGQNAINGEGVSQISNVKGTSYGTTDFNREIAATVKKGNIVPEVDLMASGNNNAVEKKLKEDLPKFLDKGMTARELMTDCDKTRDAALKTGIDRGAMVGSAKKTFSVAETGLFIADALRKKAGADIGLCYVGTSHCGTVSRIYAGDIYDADIKSLSLSVGTTSGDKNDKKLWRVSMTGDQIMALLKQGYEYDPNDNVPNIPYYVASGLKIRFAPWKDDKLLSVKTETGSELDGKKSYTVALWGWPFETKCQGTVEKVYDDLDTDIITAAVKAGGELEPKNDGSFEIVY